MKKSVLIYAGTTEGRQLAERLSNAGIHCDVRVATEYGSLVMPKLEHATVTVGRLNTEQMRALAQQGYTAIVDATHPFATEVSENIRASVAGLEVPVFRLLRQTKVDGEAGEEVRFFADAQACVQELLETEGNILLTTGSKDLAAYCQSENLRGRLFVRVLPGEESLAACHAQGISGKQIIAMQGPFSEEMNLALIHQFDIRHLVTKESGQSGGVPQKLEAAQKAGIAAYVIRNPENLHQESAAHLEEKSLVCERNFRELLETLERLAGSVGGNVSISLIGIGMHPQTLTESAKQELEKADLLFGAPRMIEGLTEGRESYPYYLLEDILPVLREKEQTLDGKEHRVAILFSGDTGFYSGAEKLKEGLNKNGFPNVRIFPGISSVSYLAAAAGETWQDAKLLSIHGRSETEMWQAQLVHAVSTSKKTFLLVSGVEDIEKIGNVLADAGFGGCEMVCGYRLGYPDEEIIRIRVLEAADSAIRKKGLYTCLILNPAAVPARVTPGLPDDAFLRGQVPMTKEEIRAVSICKLGLRVDSVVYDVGSGTGSIAVECALRSPEIRVYAIEQKEKAQQLLRQNLEQFHVHNVIPVDGSAPEALQHLEPPTHVFIGGSGGQLSRILTAVWTKNPYARIVVNAVSLETIAQMTEIQREFVPPEGYALHCACVQMQVARAREVGSYHLMQAENPVYIYTLELALVTKEDLHDTYRHSFGSTKQRQW
jgi:precorrin-6Y C5,15-methyltransferase (decarboxylating)